MPWVPPPLPEARQCCFCLQLISVSATAPRVSNHEKALPTVNDSVERCSNLWMLKFNMLLLIANSQEYCGQLCEHQISICCISYYRNLYLKAKILVIVGIIGGRDIRYLLMNNEKCNKFPYLCLMNWRVWNVSSMCETREGVGIFEGRDCLFYVCSVRTAVSTLLVLDRRYIIPITKHIFRSFFKRLVSNLVHVQWLVGSYHIKSASPNIIDNKLKNYTIHCSEISFDA